MQEIINADSFHEDYSQSSNALFHFMKQQSFLDFALQKKALFPRYCIEDVAYLDLMNDGTPFREIAVLQKCFCDIPLHKSTLQTEANVVDEETRKPVSCDTSHTGCYGKYAVAFSKEWGERQGLQPIHYLNKKSHYVRDLKATFFCAISMDELPDDITSDVLTRLAFVKPLRGKMERVFEIEGTSRNISMYKNFYDEQEWRYVPSLDVLSKLSAEAAIDLYPIIANPYELGWRNEGFLNKQSDFFVQPPFEALRLDFDYSELRYIIVPDEQARIDTINLILQLPSENFLTDIIEERCLLISKILVLQEIRKDW